MEIFPIAVIVIIGGLAVALTISIYRVRNYRDLFHSVRENYDEVLDRAMEAEREFGSLTQEFDYMKQTFTQTLALFQNRQSVAVMTDAQVQLISQTISALVQGAAKNPNQLN
jgi:hypothetical protein